MKVIFNLEEKQWEDFVLSHPKSSVFQTPYISKVYKETEKNEPFFIGVVNDKGEVLATIPTNYINIDIIRFSNISIEDGIFTAKFDYKCQTQK